MEKKLVGVNYQKEADQGAEKIDPKLKQLIDNLTEEILEQGEKEGLSLKELIQLATDKAISLQTAYLVEKNKQKLNKKDK